MRKVFEVELSSKNGCTELALPATRYALLDAVEKLELREGERPDWGILKTLPATIFTPIWIPLAAPCPN